MIWVISISAACTWTIYINVHPVASFGNHLIPEIAVCGFNQTTFGSGAVWLSGITTVVLFIIPVVVLPYAYVK